MKRISTAFFVFGLMLLCMATAAQAVGEIVTIAGGAVRDGGPATLGNVLYPGGVAVDSAGNIYLADTGHNRIRMISAAGIITTVAGNGKSGFSGDGGLATAAMLKQPMGVAVDSSGNLYIADQGNHRIRKVTAGKISTVAGTGSPGYNQDDIPATTASLNYPYGVAVSSAGDIYIADQSNCRIRKVSGGMITTVAGNGTAGDTDGGGVAKAAQLRYAAGVAIDAAGYLYIADTGNNKIKKVSPAGTISLVAGDGTFSYGGDGADATLAYLNGPTGVAVAANGDVYIADRINEVVRRVSKGIITTYAGLGRNGGYRGDGLPAAEGQLKHPSALAVDGSGNLYITEHGNNLLRKVAAGSSIFGTVAGGGAGDYYGDGGQAMLGSFSHPYGMAMKAGELYIADVENNRIRKINALGVLSTFAGNGSGTFAGDGGPATSASLNSPHGIAFSPAGELYIADSNSHRVRKVALNGNIITVAGSGPLGFTGGYTGDGGPATAATLNSPSSVAVDSSGTLYIADQNNHVVRRVKGGIISTFAGTGTKGTIQSFVKAGAATAVPLATPWWVSVDGAGNVYIADLENYCIRKVDTSGYLTTVAGTGPEAKGLFAGDGGPATSAKLYMPGGVTVDSKGDMYIADTYNFRVRKVSGGTITTVAGNGIWGYTGDNGPATAAALAHPTGVLVDPSGNLYIGDRGNKVIRKLALVTTVPGKPINVVAKALTGRATVTFAPPLSNGGSPILGYTIICNPAGGTDNNAGSGLLTHAITGLKNGVRYTFTVKARNAIGTGPASIPSNKILMGTPPYPPVMGKATAGNARATVTFTPPANNGGWPVLGYTVTSSPAGGIDVNAGSAALSHVVIGLKNGAAYTFTVKAKNVLGFGNPSVKSNVVFPATVPGAPLNVKAVKGNARATVSFSPPASNGGSAITGYTVTSVPAGGIDASAGKATLSRVITGLKNGVAYTFIVRAKNALGIGLPSLPSNKVIPSP